MGIFDTIKGAVGMSGVSVAVALDEGKDQIRPGDTISGQVQIKGGGKAWDITLFDIRLEVDTTKIDVRKVGTREEKVEQHSYKILDRVYFTSKTALASGERREFRFEFPTDRRWEPGRPDMVYQVVAEAVLPNAGDAKQALKITFGAGMAQQPMIPPGGASTQPLGSGPGGIPPLAPMAGPGGVIPPLGPPGGGIPPLGPPGGGIPPLAAGPTSEQLLQQAQMHMQQGNKEGAATSFWMAMTKAPGNADVAARTLRGLIDLGELDRAIAAAGQARASSPQSVDLIVLDAEALLRKQDFRGAAERLAMAEQGLGAQRRDPAFHGNLDGMMAYSLYQLQDYPRAGQYAKRASTAVPGQPWAAPVMQALGIV